MRTRWCCLALHRIAENWIMVGSSRVQNSARSESVRYEGHRRHEAFPAISDKMRLPTLS
jgi:hypothetical protein